MNLDYHLLSTILLWFFSWLIYHIFFMVFQVSTSFGFPGPQKKKWQFWRCCYLQWRWRSICTGFRIHVSYLISYYSCKIKIMILHFILHWIYVTSPFKLPQVTYQSNIVYDRVNLKWLSIQWKFTLTKKVFSGDWIHYMITSFKHWCIN